MRFPELVMEGIKPFPEKWMQPVPKNFDDEAINTMDKRIRERLAEHFAGWEPSVELSPAPDATAKWRIVSCLQKAVRYGDVALAEEMAYAGASVDAKYTYRRLGVIALEDVGFANLGAVASVLAAMGSSAFRKELGEGRLAAFLASWLASRARDRMCCEFLVWIKYGGELHPLSHKWVQKEDALLAATIFHPDQHPVRRAMASLLLAGTKRFPFPNMPEGDVRERSAWYEAMKEQECMPLLAYYVSVIYPRRVGDELFIALPVIGQMLLASSECVEEEMTLPRITRLGRLITPALDMHTREGKISLHKFAKECPAVAAFLSKQPNGNLRDRLLYNGIFVAEGGILSRRLKYDGSTEVYDEAHGRELEFPGCPREEQPAYLAAITGNIDLLNECRRRVLWAVANKVRR